ncbi:alpha/beta-hydrolase [Dichomitus squalens LYAD-421 SS1]|uniref:alpha/beta-hydrolase n=1 Tax=Dichomitus squalens (strain LYAD-421) TaxID=732165 RepID=UPI0004414D8B|nr:alpha/beta-hydrolase [Dichomitus squalens LYAD-421 SS1]EJF64864.1 alpha/beta-hydrolase [Dichomitus squalens LYAD-421 SS1]
MSLSRTSRSSRHDIVQLPSGTTLEYTHIQPTSPPLSATPDVIEQLRRKLAICLHPWSWLGGRMNDHVLQILTEPLLERGYDVIRYNSRGVGKSTGWASLTGHREGEDLKELVQWARSTIPHVTSLVLAGYSHGSLIASLHPVLDDIETSHILLSYPLGPRRWLTAFHGHRYSAALQSLINEPRSNILIIYGDDDNFTTAESYDAWVASLRDAPSTAPSRGKLEVVKVQGASHFWREDDAVDRLVDVVHDWLP